MTLILFLIYIWDDPSLHQLYACVPMWCSICFMIMWCDAMILYDDACFIDICFYYDAMILNDA